MTGREIGAITERGARIDAEAVGRLIRAACAAHGWSQLDLAQLSGASPSAISRWSRGEVHVQLPTLVRVLVTLGVCQEPPDIAPPMRKHYGVRAGGCTVPGCGRRHRARGYCDGHYKRWKEWGEPLVDWPIGSLVGKRRASR